MKTSATSPRKRNAPSAAHGARSDAPSPTDVTRSALVEVARRAFELDGFDGTDTNRIARAAGFAPQTFYRHFRDKRAIFVEVYSRWVDEQVELGAGAATLREAATAVLRNHAAAKAFRRSLRALAITDPSVRAVRARERIRQIEALRARFPKLRERPLDEVAAALLAVERFADAIVDGETDDLGITPPAARRQLVRLLGRLTGGD